MAEQPAVQGGERAGWWKRPLFRWLVFLELLVLFGFAYVNLAAHLVSQTNHSSRDLHQGGQLDHLRAAAETRADLQPDLRRGLGTALTDLLPHRTDGVINPLWPWTAAWFADGGRAISAEEMNQAGVSEPVRELFERGRWFHVFMTLAFLAMLGIAACRIFSLPAACNLVLLGGLGALLPRAAYFQPEPLYFVLFFLAWVACVSALQHNSLWIYGVIGVLAGLAYLAKASTFPLLAVFVGVSSLRCLWEMLSARRRGFALSQSSLWHWRNHLVGLVVLAAAHFMTIAPRLKDAHEKFGSAFHNYPALWMWLDDEAAARAWTEQHRTRDALAAVLPAEWPSPANYWRTHTREDIIHRLWNGAFGAPDPKTGIAGRVPEFFWPVQTGGDPGSAEWSGWRGILEWRGLYLGWLLLILLGLLGVLAAAPKPQHVGHLIIRPGTGAIVLFVAGSFALYSLAYGFYAPLAPGSGDRFMLSLYLPLVFSLIWGAESIIRRIQRRKGSPWIARGYLLAQWILFAAIAWRVVEILRLPKFHQG